jgi:hypothetical protein
MRKPTSFYLFKRKPIVRKSRREYWREVADLTGLSVSERLRVDMDGVLLYNRAGKCRSNCQILRYLQEDFSQMTQAV